MKATAILFLSFFALPTLLYSQEDRYFQFEGGSFKIFSDRGNVSGYNFRIGGGNIFYDFLELGFEAFYNRANFNDEILAPVGGGFLTRSESEHGSAGLTGIVKLNLVPLISDNRSQYSFHLETGFGTTVSGYEIFAWHAMGALSAGYEIDRNLLLIVNWRIFYYWSDKVLDDINFNEKFQVVDDNSHDYYRTWNAGFRIIF